jgi:uncharacterized protein YyaL (SSP411 family)
MAQRGLHDHLSGGFFRYAVDPGWGIPHFEKMLYDNANLAMLYLEAGRVLDNPHYFEVARRTLDFMRDRMWHDDGALVASFSAVDDANVEGGYYLWQAQDLAGVLTQEEVQLAASLWGLGRPAELEAGNHIRYAMTLQEYAEESGIDAADAASVLQRTREKLLAARARRSLPVDDKLIAGWNGLALHAFAAAAKTWPDSSYPETAAALREFLLEQLWQDGRLQRALAAGRPLGSASLEDYAYVAAGLLSWARLNDRRQDYVEARSVAEAAWSRFYRDNGWYQEDGTLLAPTSAEEMVADGAMASPAAVVIEVSLELAAYFDDEGMRRRALSALNRGDTLLSRAPYWYASQLGARALAISP